MPGFDIAPFALPNTPKNEVWFEDPRDINRMVVTCVDTAPESVTLSYLRKTWPQSKLETLDPAAHSHATGWIGIDDWFNSKWQEAAIEVERIGDRTLEITFKGLASELDEAADYDVHFRRTLGIKVDPVPRQIEIYTTSECTTSDVRVIFVGDSSVPNDLGVVAYNSGFDDPTVDGNTMRLCVKHMIPAHAFSYDEGLLTFESEDDAFTISLDALAKQGPIWYEDKGIFITFADDPTTLEQYVARNSGRQTTGARVEARREQSLSGAMNGQPRPHPCSCSVGCKHARQRFWLEPNGDIMTMRNNLHWIKGRDTERCKLDGDGRFSFGLGNWQVLGRHFDPAPVMAYSTHLMRGSLALEQKTFAVPLEKSIFDDILGDDTIICLSRFTFTNNGDEPVVAELPISYSPDSSRFWNRLEARDRQSDDLVPVSNPEKLSVSPDGIVRGEWHGQPVLRCAIESDVAAADREPGVVLRKRLAPGESCSAVLRIPHIDLDQPSEIAALASLDYEKCYEDARRFWREECSKGAQIHTGEPILDALYKSHLAHVELTDARMPDDLGLINVSVGTSTYGNYTNESCMIVEELDERGLHEMARQRIDVWLKYQGTKGLVGQFTDHDGVFYGAGGFEMGESYDQHHGWVLWIIARHFELTGDVDWLRSVADKLIKGVDWVTRQRVRQAQDARGSMDWPHSRGWERGFLAAGALEDVTDFFNWLSTNALTWRGVDAAARALDSIDRPEAKRIRAEADDYRESLIRGFEKMRQMSPLVRLKDGRWIPHYPSRLYRRGRDIGWIREVLEGSVYLLISELFDADSPQARWILDDYLDNRYMAPYYGYPVFDPEHNWVDYGGFSNQPNLLAGLLPHLDRDEPEIYIWMFMNAWAACYRAEVNAMVEHPQPILGFSNSAIYKTSDQANAIKWLRYMFVYGKEHPELVEGRSDGGLLHFGRAIPREWLRDGGSPYAHDVATRFGKVSVSYQSRAASGTITATVGFPGWSKPAKTLLRFRHPDKLPIKSVTVNGGDHELFDPDAGDVDITGFGGTVEVVALY